MVHVDTGFMWTKDCLDSIGLGFVVFKDEYLKKNGEKRLTLFIFNFYLIQNSYFPSVFKSFFSRILFVIALMWYIDVPFSVCLFKVVYKYFEMPLM